MMACLSFESEVRTELHCASTSTHTATSSSCFSVATTRGVKSENPPLEDLWAPGEWVPAEHGVGEGERGLVSANPSRPRQAAKA